MSDSLRKVGFEVYTYQDSDLKTMTEAINGWCEKISKYDVALFYYSGHGAEVNGENFLFPIDANPKGPSDLHYTAYSASQLLSRIDNSGSRLNILILDACRNNPFAKNWSRDMGKGGLASMAGRGSFIGYAASPGHVADDGIRRNGIYTEAILKNITVPGLTIDRVFTNVNKYVRDSTANQQVPFKNSSLSIDYCFSVKRSKNSTSEIKKSSFTQPISAIMLSSKEENIFTVDSSAGGLSVRDGKTFNVVKSLLYGKGMPFKVISKIGNDLYILDSSENALLIVDWQQSIVKRQIKFDFAPTSIALLDNEKKAYVSFRQPNSNSSIGIIDLVGYKIKKISTPAPISSLILSPDNKLLYASSGSDTLSRLLIINTKTEKIIKILPHMSFGEALGISPDNKKAYASYKRNDNDGYQTHVIDLKSLKVIDTIYSNPTSFAFTNDSKYVFILSNLEISVIRTADNQLTNRLPFATSPAGLCISSYGTAYVWLPYEKRIFAFNLQDQLERSFTVDLESNLKRFKDEKRNDTAGLEFSLTWKIFEEGHWAVNEAVVNLKNDLWPGYETISDKDELDYNKKIKRRYLGLFFLNDEKKKIFPLINWEIHGNLFVLSMQEDGKDEEVFKSPLTNVDWESVKVFVRSYFLKRIDQLK
jgi:DNA-binding beta-propeller fold protein YncE